MGHPKLVSIVQNFFLVIPDWSEAFFNFVSIHVRNFLFFGGKFFKYTFFFYFLKLRQLEAIS